MGIPCSSVDGHAGLGDGLAGKDRRRCRVGDRHGATSLEKLDPSTSRSAPALEPSEGEQDERYDERTDRVLHGDVSGARLEPREQRGKATRWNEPVHGGNGKEQDTKKSGDQRQGSVHRAGYTRGAQIFRYTASGRYPLPRREAALPRDDLRLSQRWGTDFSVLVAILGDDWFATEFPGRLQASQ
jgi:hypothetical protein